jgi:hypothetical protein
LSTLRAVNDEIWYPAAQVAFSTATDSIPVIADPSPPGGGSGSLGDLEVAFLSNEANRAATACTQAWAELQPGRPGLPVVNARKFINSGAIEGVSPGPATALYVASRNPLSGRRGDDLCGAPQRLTPADIGTPFVVMPDQGFLTRPTLVLAHELGHNLFLGHGNGLDDNGDGTRAGRPGPKRYDEYCDAGWLAPPMNLDVAEDLGTRLVSCEASSSLMNRFASCTNLRPLQTETARGVARLHPGAVDGTEQPVLAPVR